MRWRRLLGLERVASSPRRAPARWGVEPLEARALLSASSLDPGFGTGGLVTTSLGNGPDQIEAAVIQSDGKIVVAGWTTQLNGTRDFALARYLTSGALDTTFDADGLVVTDLNGRDNFFTDLTLDSLNRIVAVGGTVAADGTYDFIVARYTSSGALDPTFGNQGFASIPFNFPGDDVARSVALDSLGRIVVAGEARGADGSQDFAVARLTANGLLDGNFGIGGRTTTNFTRGDDVAYDVLIDSFNRVIAVGTAFAPTNTQDVALVRYTAVGILDGTFGSQGIVTTPVGQFDDVAYDATFDAQGRIVVAGASVALNGSLDFALLRYSSNGVLDLSFDVDGKTTTSFGTQDDVARAVAIDANGKIVVAGFATLNGQRDVALARYLTNGSLDTTFDGDGRLTTPISATRNDAAHALRIDAQNKLVVAGYVTPASGFDDFALLRYGDGFSVSGSTLFLNGTSGADQLSVHFSSTTNFTATINGQSESFSTTAISSIVIDGLGGYDTLSVSTPATFDDVVMQPTLLNVTGSGYTIAATSVEQVYYYGDAGDRIILVDSPGNDVYYGLESTSVLYGADYFQQVIGPRLVYAYSLNGGVDVAYLYDTPGDNSLFQLPTSSLMVASDYLNQAIGFDAVYSIASTGYDVAVMSGSTGSDVFYGTPTISFLTGTGYYNQANGFDAIYVDGAGGSDSASLLDSPGDDTFLGLATTSVLYGTEFYYQVSNFSSVVALASGGDDQAVLYDSTGNDFLRAADNFALIIYPAGYNVAVGFDRVTAVSSNGGTDTRRIEAISYLIFFLGPWTDV